MSTARNVIQAAIQSEHDRDTADRLRTENRKLRQQFADNDVVPKAFHDRTVNARNDALRSAERAIEQREETIHSRNQYADAFFREQALADTFKRWLTGAFVYGAVVSAALAAALWGLYA